MLYEQIVRPVLFSMDPEDAHLRTMRLLGAAAPVLGPLARVYAVRDLRLETTRWGLQFPTPVGLAAGVDKHGEAVAAWPKLGAGFVEVGTVTPRPQYGNPRPRLFRLIEDYALINRMGFNSVGADAVRRHLSRAGSRAVPVGVNVGRNRDTSNVAAADDCRSTIAILRAVADYFVVNVSSPNTAGLRDLQRPDSLHQLVTVAVAAASEPEPRRPVLVKVSPDLPAGELDETVDAIVSAGADGIVATNTTIDRQALHSPHANESGGLSGAPLRRKANEACRRIFRRTAGRIPIVGVGGISGVDAAYERIRSGASLVQIYTALIYEGPGLFSRLNRGLLEMLERDRLSHISDAVGLDA